MFSINRAEKPIQILKHRRGHHNWRIRKGHPKFVVQIREREAFCHTLAERKTVPELGCSSPEISLRIVDLPIPFAPTTAKR